MDSHTAVLNFRDALVASFAEWKIGAEAALKVDRGFLDESFGDWTQAHWELLVERVLCAPNQFLKVYADGTDYEMAMHSRVFFCDAKPTHEIACECNAPLPDLLSGANINLVDWQFDRFVTFVDNWYNETPPFDHLLLSDPNSDNRAVTKMSDVIFKLRKMGTAG